MNEQASVSTRPQGARALGPVLTALRRCAVARGLHVGQVLEELDRATADQRAECHQLEALALGFAYFPEDRDRVARQRAREQGRDPTREVRRFWRELARRFPAAFARALKLRGSKLHVHLERRAPDVLRGFNAH